MLVNLPLSTGGAVLQCCMQFWAPQYKRRGIYHRVQQHGTQMGRGLQSQAFPSVSKDSGRAGTNQPAAGKAHGGSREGSRGHHTQNQRFLIRPRSV